jgi:transposase
MTKKKSEAKQGRKQYSVEFKHQALLRAVKDGVPAAARDLGLEPAQLYAWRSRAQQRGEDAEAQQLMQSDQARLKREVARLEEEVAFLKKAAAYFAKQPK